MSAVQPWLLWALGSAFFAALTAIFAKIVVSALDSNYATFIRVVILVPVLALIVTFSHAWRAPTEISARTWMALALSALATGASWLCYFHALKIGDAARVAPVDKLSVVLVAIFGVLFLGEGLSPRNWLGVALIGAGAVLVALKG